MPASTGGSSAAKLNYVIAARDAEFRRVADRVTRRLERLERGGRRTTRSFNRLGDSLRRFPGFPAVLGAAAATLSLRNLNARLSESIARVDALAKRADNIGLPVEDLQLWSQAAREAGVEVDAFQRGLLRFNRVVGEAASGAGEYEEIFERLGVRIRGADGQLRPMRELVHEVAMAFRGLDAATQQLTIEELFGRGGREMRQFFLAFQESIAAVEEDFVATSDAAAQLAQELQNIRDRAGGQLQASMDELYIALDRNLQVTQRIAAAMETAAGWAQAWAENLNRPTAVHTAAGRAQARLGQVDAPLVGPQTTVTASDVTPAPAGPVRVTGDTSLTRAQRLRPDRYARADLTILRDLVRIERRLVEIRRESGPAAEALERARREGVTVEREAVLIVNAQVEAEARLAEARAMETRRLQETQQRLGEFISSFVRGTGSVRQALASLLDSLISRLSHNIAGSLLGGGLGGIFGSIGDLFGFQRGGAVSRGRAIVVGEGGPELFVPRSPGYVVPNAALHTGGAAAAGGAGVTVNLNFAIESTDGPGVRAALREAEPTLTRAALQAVAVQQTRPGSVLGRQNRGVG